MVKTRLVVLAVFLSVVAVVLAGTSLLVSLRYDDVATTSAGPEPQPAATTEPPAEPTDAAETSEPPSGTGGPEPTDTGEIRPSGAYTIVYEGKRQRVPAGTQVNLDEPRVNVQSDTGDLYNSAGALSTENARALVSTPDPTPEECEDAIQNAPLTRRVPATDQVVLCLKTSANAAVNQGITRKLVVVRVEAVDRDGTVTMVLKAWNIPD